MLLSILAICGDFYLAINILIKAGVKPAFVAIQILLDFFLAILPFLLLSLGVKFMDKVTIKNWILFYELDSKLERVDESEENREARYEDNKKTQLPNYRKMLTWCKVLTWIINLSIFGIAIWKILTYASSVPFSILGAAKGKMVITVAILVAIFHVLATENALIHFMYWLKKKGAIKEAERTQDLTKNPALSKIPIPYKGDFKAAKSGYTELVVNEDKSVDIKYAYIIRDEDIYKLMSENVDSNAKRGIIAICKQRQLN